MNPGLKMKCKRAVWILLILYGFGDCFPAKKEDGLSLVEERSLKNDETGLKEDGLSHVEKRSPKNNENGLNENCLYPDEEGCLDGDSNDQNVGESAGGLSFRSGGGVQHVIHIQHEEPHKPEPVECQPPRRGNLTPYQADKHVIHIQHEEPHEPEPVECPLKRRKVQQPAQVQQHVIHIQHEEPHEPEPVKCPQPRRRIQQPAQVQQHVIHIQHEEPHEPEPVECPQQPAQVQQHVIHIHHEEPYEPEPGECPPNRYKLNPHILESQAQEPHEPEPGECPPNRYGLHILEPHAQAHDACDPPMHEMQDPLPPDPVPEPSETHIHLVHEVGGKPRAQSQVQADRRRPCNPLPLPGDPGLPCGGGKKVRYQAAEEIEQQHPMPPPVLKPNQPCRPRSCKSRSRREAQDGSGPDRTVLQKTLDLLKKHATQVWSSKPDKWKQLGKSVMSKIKKLFKNHRKSLGIKADFKTKDTSYTVKPHQKHKGMILPPDSNP